MKKQKIMNLEKISITLTELAQIMSVGRYSAEKIATESKALFRIGRRRLVYMPKLQRYLEEISAKEV